MELAPLHSFFRDVEEKVGHSLVKYPIATLILEILKEKGEKPLLVLPELSPIDLSPSITFEEGVKILKKGLPGNLPQASVLLSFPAFGYGCGRDIEAYDAETFSLELVLTLLKKGSYSEAFILVSLYLDETLEDFLSSISRERIEIKGFAKEPSQKFILYRLDGKRVKECYIPPEVDFEGLPLVVVGSPLRNYPSDGEIEVPPVRMVRVGMSQLKSNFVFEDDLLEGSEITDEEERKKVWSAVSKRNKLFAPYLKKGDILLPIKREKNFNVAIVCEELPSYSPLFVPKGDLVIIRSRGDELDFRAMHSLAQVLLAGFKSLSGERFRELSGGKSFFISDLRGVLAELFSDGEFTGLLRSAPVEEVLETGRKSFRNALRRYFEKKSVL
jgi:hypothetical protein